jgi:(2R)-3-sulfolactate dehydrogenase (NADP+)
MVAVTLDQIEALSVAALTRHGAAPWVAAEVAHAVRRAEETGNVICGLYYLESYCLQLASGRVKGDVEPIVTRPRPGSVKADAKFGFAQAAFARALPEAIAAAKENGTASLAVAHAHTCTSLGFFTEQIAAAGLIGIGFTNASPVVAPPGGNKAVIGTNPMAMTVPGHGAPVMHFDFSTSAVALGKITMAKAAGESIPLGWAVDVDGKPTTDPEAALKGALVSAGGYKGWGFGLMGEVMAAAMTGSVNSLDVGGLKLADGPPHGLGQFYLLMDPGTYTDAFDARVARVVDAVAEQPDARIPGASRKLKVEVQVADDLWKKLSDLT